MMPGTAIEGGGGSRDSSEFEFISKVSHFLEVLVFRFNKNWLTAITKELTQIIMEYNIFRGQG